MTKAINVQSLSFAYKNKYVLSNVSFSLEKGSAAAIIGENGSGKSTLLSCIAKSVKPSGGTVQTDGKIAYIPQETALVEELTFDDNLKFFASLAGCKVPKELPFCADELRKTKIKHMSGGMKKLCSICCAVIADADIYLFDEPCASLDKEHKTLILDYIAHLKQCGKTVLYVGHDQSEYSAFADTLLICENGCIIVCDKRGEIQ